MEFLLENILNLVGFLVGLAIGIMSFVGFRNTGSPTLFRLTIAFFSISIGFLVIWFGYMLEDYVIKSGNIDRGIQTLGIIIQTIGYFSLTGPNCSVSGIVSLHFVHVRLINLSRKYSFYLFLM